MSEVADRYDRIAAGFTLRGERGARGRLGPPGSLRGVGGP